MSLNHATETELAVWEEAKTLHAFRADDLTKYGVQHSTAQKYIRCWKHRGWVVVREIDENQRRTYCAVELATQGKQPVTEEATPEGNMWRVMRHLKTFTSTDVAAHANAGGIEVTEFKARRYCHRLLEVDYLRVRTTAIPGKREAVYAMILDTGPRAPVTARLQGILDPNTDTFFPADARLRT